MVVADTPEHARAAVKLVKIDYTELPGIYTMAEGVKADSYIVRTGRETGDVEKCKAEAEIVKVRVSKDIQPQDHVCMEPVSAIGYAKDGRVTVYACTQAPFEVRRMLAKNLAMDEENIRVVATPLGGGFGKKCDSFLEAPAAVAALCCDKPVKVTLTRQEDMIVTTRRHGYHTDYEIGFSKDGRFRYLDSFMFSDGGPYEAESYGTLMTGCLMSGGPYIIPNVKVEGSAIRNNNLQGGAFRGYGNTQLTFGREILMDRLAQKLDMDPVEFRLMNHVQVGECFPCASIPVSSNGIEDCARRCQQIQKEIDEKEPLIDDENIRQAWGISFSCHGSGPSSKEGLSGAVVMLNADASVHLLVGSADIGQGSETMESQIAAECLGIPLSSVQITAADTGLTPYNTGTFGSSQTFICGNAVKLACDDLKKKMVEQLKVIYDGCTVKEKNHRYYISGGEELELSFEDAARKILFDPKGSVPIGAGTYKALACPNPFSVCFVKAEYHKKLNAIRLMDIIEVVDVGTPINRLTVAGQLEGGIAQGVGYALYERMEINPRSRRTLSTDFLHYRIPQMGDMPRTYVDMVNSHDPYGPHGAKSVGELATVPVAPAIVNAVRRASGIEINSLPLCDKFAILPTERGNVK